MTSTETTVRALLDTAGIKCSEAEFDAFVDQYPTLRAKVDAMYAPAFADANPLLVLASDRE
jgi:hypothetical protein